MMAMNIQYRAMPKQPCNIGESRLEATAPRKVPNVHPAMGVVISPPKKGKLTSSFSIAAKANTSSVMQKAITARL